MEEECVSKLEIRKRGAKVQKSKSSVAQASVRTDQLQTYENCITGTAHRAMFSGSHTA